MRTAPTPAFFEALARTLPEDRVTREPVSYTHLTLPTSDLV